MSENLKEKVLRPEIEAASSYQPPRPKRHPEQAWQRDLASESGARCTRLPKRRRPI